MLEHVGVPLAASTCMEATAKKLLVIAGALTIRGWPTPHARKTPPRSGVRVKGASIP